MPLLMSAENPKGAKLEEILEEIAVELEAKNKKLEDDFQPCSIHVSNNNLSIISHLRKCVAIQNNSMAVLAELAPDTGPLGSPRIGK